MTTLKIYKDMNNRLMKRIEELKQELKQELKNSKCTICTECAKKDFEKKHKEHRDFERKLFRLGVSPETYWEAVTEHFYSNPY